MKKAPVAAMLMPVLLSASVAGAGNPDITQNTCLGTPVSIARDLIRPQELLDSLSQSGTWSVVNALFVGFVSFAIIAQFLNYLGGRRIDPIGMLLRILIGAVLLATYNSPGNWRDVIRLSCEQMGAAIQGGVGPYGILKQIGINLVLFNLTENQSGWLDTLKTVAAVAKLFYTMAGPATLLFGLISGLVGVMSYAIDIARVVFLMTLDYIGPYFLVFATMESTAHYAWNFISKYFEISLWSVLYSAIMVSLTAAYSVAVGKLPTMLFLPNPVAADDPTKYPCIFMSMVFMGAVGCIALFLLMSIPGFSSSLLSGRSRGFEKGVVASVMLLPRVAQKAVETAAKIVLKAGA